MIDRGVHGRPEEPLPKPRRRWAILFDPDRTHPWVARSEKGAECFFVTPQALVQFLVDGGLGGQAITEVIFSLKSGRQSAVELEDSWGQ